jgi:hypothetical protein
MGAVKKGSEMKIYFKLYVLAGLALAVSGDVHAARTRKKAKATVSEAAKPASVLEQEAITPTKEEVQAYFGDEKLSKAEKISALTKTKARLEKQIENTGEKKTGERADGSQLENTNDGFEKKKITQNLNNYKKRLAIVDINLRYLQNALSLQEAEKYGFEHDHVALESKPPFMTHGDDELVLVKKPEHDYSRDTLPKNLTLEESEDVALTTPRPRVEDDEPILVKRPEVADEGDVLPNDLDFETMNTLPIQEVKNKVKEVLSYEGSIADKISALETVIANREKTIKQLEASLNVEKLSHAKKQEIMANLEKNKRNVQGLDLLKRTLSGNLTQDEIEHYNMEGLVDNLKEQAAREHAQEQAGATTTQTVAQEGKQVGFLAKLRTLLGKPLLDGLNNQNLSKAQEVRLRMDVARMKAQGQLTEQEATHINAQLDVLHRKAAHNRSLADKTATVADRARKFKARVLGQDEKMQEVHPE